jgi:hypothetical protein
MHTALTVPRCTEAAPRFGLRVFDHIIITKKSHFSFQESDLIAGCLALLVFCNKRGFTV